MKKNGLFLENIIVTLQGVCLFVWIGTTITWNCKWKILLNIFWKEIKTDHDLISTEDSGCVCSNFPAIIETVMFVTSEWQIIFSHSSGFQTKVFYRSQVMYYMYIWYIKSSSTIIL